MCKGSNMEYDVYGFSRIEDDSLDSELLWWDRAYQRSGLRLPRAVLNTIRTYADPETLEATVSQDTLASDTGLTEKQVSRQVKDNEAAGWVQRLDLGTRGRFSTYKLTYPPTHIGIDSEIAEQIQELRERLDHLCSAANIQGPL